MYYLHIFKMSSSNAIDKFGRGHHHTPQPKMNKLQIPYTQSGDYNFENKKLANISDPIDAGDAVNKKYIDGCIDSTIKQIQRDYVVKQTSYTNKLDAALKAFKNTIIKDVEQVKVEINNKISIINKSLLNANAAYINLVNKVKNIEQELLKVDELERKNITLTNDILANTTDISLLKKDLTKLKTP